MTHHASEPIYPGVTENPRRIPYRHGESYTLRAVFNSLHHVLPLTFRLLRGEPRMELMRQWLISTMGEQPAFTWLSHDTDRYLFNQHARWQLMGDRVCFRNQQDLLLFKLAWA